MKSITFKDKHDNGYLYSFYHKRLLPLDPLLYNMVSSYLATDEIKGAEYNLGVDDLCKSNNSSEKQFVFLKENHFLDDKIVQTYGSLTFEDIKQNIESFPVLIFEVTEKCNFKCKYCIYGDMYISHSNKMDKELSFEKAKAIIDYFVKFVNDKPSIRKKKSIYFFLWRRTSFALRTCKTNY